MNPITTVKPVAAGLQTLNSAPNDIRINILKYLGANTLCIVGALNKAWNKIHNEKTVWIHLANKVRIRLVNPDNGKAEVIEYWKLLPKINAVLPGLNLQDKDPFEKNLKEQDQLKTMLANPQMHSRVLDSTKDLIERIKRSQIRGETVDKVLTLSLQIVLDIGCIPTEKMDWSNVIYHIDFPKGFREHFQANGGYHRLLCNSILHTNISYIKFILQQLEKAPQIDVTSIIFMCWPGAFEQGLDPNAPSTITMVQLFAHLNIDATRMQSLIEAAERHANAKSSNGDTQIAQAEIRIGLDFIRKHFLNKPK